jgi:hypothetical protein
MRSVRHQDKPVIYRIEQDDSTKRKSFGPYTYRIYEDDRLVAKYWHDYRGDDHGIEFVTGTVGDFPFPRMTDFIEGGGPEPLRLSDRAVDYLKSLRSLKRDA